MTKVACIGECMIELKQAQGDDQGDLYSRGYGGDTLNTAVYLARLGVEIDYITALGDDPMSDEMIAGWAAEGVGTQQVVRLKGKLPGPLHDPDRRSWRSPLLSLAGKCCRTQPDGFARNRRHPGFARDL